MSTQQPAPPRRKRPAKPQFTQTTLLLEAFLVGFATLVAFGLRVAPPATVWTLGGVTCVVLVLLSGYMGRPGGYVAGTLAQLAVLGFGVLVPMMYGIGAVFVVLWIVALRLGGRIDRERAEWDAAHPEGPAPA
ncbi:DUF4233 domain-containing protein [Cellulomonas phragmiteti]|uniref:DUF4233 domain-containing protein n=1 Tax=Cellulomonas phragmiteti TaxID=478780 RepID=A0ABQ4DGF0_9CELL|nr:DUF4233 domain-containing protein [Cellulomonas phragmiteti]GIG38420.1 hypothetical protein Cph01nite_01820 [Cellulomonas phragmiteti]